MLRERREGEVRHNLVRGGDNGGDAMVVIRMAMVGAEVMVRVIAHGPIVMPSEEPNCHEWK